jgi:hypothetical protein
MAGHIRSSNSRRRYQAYNHHVFVVGIARQQLENAIENAALRHRLKRWYTMFQSPKRAGKSRQGTPVRYL